MVKSCNTVKPSEGHSIPGSQEDCTPQSSSGLLFDRIQHSARQRSKFRSGSPACVVTLRVTCVLCDGRGICNISAQLRLSRMFVWRSGPDWLVQRQHFNLFCCNQSMLLWVLNMDMHFIILKTAEQFLSGCYVSAECYKQKYLIFGPEGAHTRRNRQTCNRMKYNLVW